ncbi:prepilin peptidase-dependent protein [Pantoea sp. BAV 3049]|uniref:prepilin peptidase-dependent protein n=1 Tax=Pantoea sp. BAV 3049 TaxID=2654188 RepID=UPI00131DC937|nr:prepilin peptidase-dependent protein [Pantoea sp. BAV 3049]
MKINPGFTLLELLVVMIIASTLTLTALVGWQNWQQQQRLNASARQLQHFLLRLRNEANWHNRQQLLWQRSGNNWCVGSGPLQLTCQRQRRVFVAPWPEITLRSVTEGMGFYGRRNVAKPGRIVIANAAGERHIIVSSRARVRICQDSCP